MTRSAPHPRDWQLTRADDGLYEVRPVRGSSPLLVGSLGFCLSRWRDMWRLALAEEEGRALDSQGNRFVWAGNVRSTRSGSNGVHNGARA